MVELFVIVTLMILSAIGGGSLGVLTGIPELIGIFAFIGSIAGTICGYFVIAGWKAIQKQERTIPETRQIASPHKPRSFRDRLAIYLHRDRSDVMRSQDSFRSAMPFWSSLTVFLRIQPKSAEQIRQTLLRIRKTLRP